MVGPSPVRPGDERRVEIERVALDVELLGFEQAGQQVVGEVLLVTQLGMLVDLVRRVDEHVGPLVDLRRQTFLHRCEIHGDGLHDAHEGVWLDADAERVRRPDELAVEPHVETGRRRPAPPRPDAP